MVCLDSDIIGILLALLTVVVPAIVKAFDNSKKKDNDASNGQDPNKKEELEVLFEEFMGKEDSKYSADDEYSHHIVMCEEELPEQHFAGPSQMETYIEEFQERESRFEEPVVREIIAEELQSGHIKEAEPQTQQHVCNEESEESRETSLKERFRNNPEDAVIFAEILKPKFKEF
ncbi:MAG: hypothetical protein E7122_02510 [Bacteroidales bacterium]|nr:hypothetical protein [Bacteroidales bacterium]